MEAVNDKTLMEAMKIFKETYGVYEPLDLERLEIILKQIKESK